VLVEGGAENTLTRGLSGSYRRQQIGPQGVMHFGVQDYPALHRIRVISSQMFAEGVSG